MGEPSHVNGATPTAPVAALASVLTRATTLELAQQPPVKVEKEPEQAGVAAQPIPADSATSSDQIMFQIFQSNHIYGKKGHLSLHNYVYSHLQLAKAPGASEPDAEKAQKIVNYKVMRAKKAKWHRSMKSPQTKFMHTYWIAGTQEY